MKEWQDFDIKVITKAEGPWLIDSDGRKYLDGVASMWCNVWGHTRKEIVKTMIEQVKKLQHSTLFGLANEPSISLAQMLVQYAEGMSKVFYSDNGSTAIEVALKMALQYWRNLGHPNKNEFVALQNAYHGDTIGTMSVGYIESFFANYQKVLFSVKRVASPYLYRRPSKISEEDYITHCIDSMEHVLKNNSKVAAVIMESGAQLAGGAIIYPEGYQREIKKLCEKYDTLFILDEIATGFGRLGSMVEYISQKSTPDIVAFGKMLTAGYLPLAVTLSTEDVYNAFLGKFDERKHLFHGHTFTGNPIGCATAIANLQLYKKEHLLEDIQRKAKVISKRLAEMENFEIVGDVRQKGMLAGIELVSDKLSKKPCVVRGKQINYLVMQESLKRGVFLRSLGHILLLVPPLAIPRSELNIVIDVVGEIVKQIQKINKS
jgi:adenosylmethionine-8-amino-7-oxononanoate aminotransferase